MALLSIFRGTQAECSARPVSDGTLLFAADTKKIYLDKGSSRIEMSSVDDLSNYVTKEQLTTALNGKANTTHTHTQDQVTGLKDALAGKANAAHTHAIADVTGLQTALNGKADKATTLAGYGIGDAYTKNEIDTAYKAADTALGTRIGNAEAEISANSADLTGIKGLTYGDTHVNFIENNNGEYSSPALEEIAEQAAAAGWSTVTIESYTGTLTHDELTQLKSNWPHVMISVGGVNFLYPKTFIGANYEFLSVLPSTRGSAYADGLKVNANTGEHLALNTFYAPYWSKVSQKPFSTIGTGLKVVNDALTVDTSATPAGITANTTWSELESAVTQP